MEQAAALALTASLGAPNSPPHPCSDRAAGGMVGGGWRLRRVSVSAVWRPGQETKMIMLDVRILDRRRSKEGLDLNAPPFSFLGGRVKGMGRGEKRACSIPNMMGRWRAKMGASRDLKEVFFKVLDGAHHRPI